MKYSTMPGIDVDRLSKSEIVTLNAYLSRRLTTTQIDELGALFGPPPVLSSEEAAHYEQMFQGMNSCFMPMDFVELMFIRMALDEAWKIKRYRRNQTVGIERRFRQSLEYQERRKTEIKKRREAAAEQLAVKLGRPVSELQQMVALEEIIETSVSDVDAILEKTATEFQHNHALEAGILLEQQFDKLIGSAQARLNDAVKQLEHYRAGLGAYWQEMVNEILMDVTFHYARESKSKELDERVELERQIAARRSANKTSSTPANERPPHVAPDGDRSGGNNVNPSEQSA